jgi:hypothetical protein
MNNPRDQFAKFRERFTLLQARAREDARGRLALLQADQPWGWWSSKVLRAENLRRRLVSLIYRRRKDWPTDDVVQWLLRCGLEENEVVEVLKALKSKEQKAEWLANWSLQHYHRRRKRRQNEQSAHCSGD